MDRKEIDAALVALRAWIIRVCNNESASPAEMAALAKATKIYLNATELLEMIQKN